MNLYYKECEIGDNIAAYLDTCEPSEIPDELKQWFEKTREQVAEIGVELKNELIEQLSKKDVKDYYEIAGYLTGTIASFFIGAGEAKTASKAGKLGKAKQLQIKNPSKAIGMNINEIESIKGYKIVTKTDGTKYLRRENGMTNKLEKLSVDKNDIIIKVDAEVKGGNLLDKNKNSRPSWRQSELDVAKDYPNYAEQKSFLNGQDVPYGTKGSIRPDFYKTSKSIDVKNYNLEKETGKINSVRNIEEQYNKRIYHLPSGTKQTILIDKGAFHGRWI